MFPHGFSCDSSICFLPCKKQISQHEINPSLLSSGYLFPSGGIDLIPRTTPQPAASCLRSALSATPFVPVTSFCATAVWCTTSPTYQTICPGIKGLQLPDLPPNHIIAHNKTPIFHRPAQFDDLSALLQIILRQADQQAPLYLHICQQLMLSVLKLTEQMIREYGTENNIQLHLHPLSAGSGHRAAGKTLFCQSLPPRACLQTAHRLHAQAVYSAPQNRRSAGSSLLLLGQHYPDCPRSRL